MALVLTGNFTADGNSDLGAIVNPNNGTTIYQVIYASGDFGAGTITPQWTIDGTTFVGVTDDTGAVTLTDDDAVRIFLLGDNGLTSDRKVQLRLNLAGATNPDIQYRVMDCR